MKANEKTEKVILEKTGLPEVFVLREVSLQKPGSGEVLVDIHAAGINFADIHMRMGAYPWMPKLPFSPGFEGAGTILELGAGVQDLKVGDKVIVYSIKDLGCYARQGVFERNRIYPLPSTFSMEEGASLMATYITAWVALFEGAHARKGEKLLLHMAAGGVGLAAIQLARDLDLEIIGLTSSESKLEFLSKAGVKHPVNISKKDFVEEVKAITKGAGVDIIMDPVGGETTKRGQQLLGPMGRLVCYGASSFITGKKRKLAHIIKSVLRPPKWDFYKLPEYNIGVSGFHIGILQEKHPEYMNGIIAQLLRACEEGKLKPDIAQTFPLEKVADAHHYIQERKNVGKVVLMCNK